MSHAEVDALAVDLASRAQLGPGADGAVTWDTSTTPGSALPVLSSRVSRFLPFAASAGTSVANTTTETSLLTSTLAVPADTWAIGSVLRWSLYGVITNNTGANRDVTIRVKDGAGTVFSLVFSAIPASATERTFTFDATTLMASIVGATLLGAGRLALSATSAAADTIVRTQAASVVINQPLDQITTWDITVQHSAASASLSASLRLALIEHFTP